MRSHTGANTLKGTDMKTNSKLASIATSAALAVGGIAGLATPVQAQGTGATGGAVVNVMSLTEQLTWTEQVFKNATPGSPAQFRARESADSLRERISTP